MGLLLLNELEEIASMAIECAQQENTVAAWEAAVEANQDAVRHYEKRDLFAMAKHWQLGVNECRARAAAAAKEPEDS